MTHIPLLLSLPLLVGPAEAVAPARPAAGADLAGVIAGIEARGRLLNNLRFDADYRLRTQPNHRKGEPLIERRERLRDVILVFGDGPREAPTEQGVRLSTTGGSGEPLVYEATRSWGVTRELFRFDAGRPLGRLKVEPTFRWVVHPCEVLGLGFGSPLVELDGARSRSFGGPEVIGGRACVRLDWAAESNNPPGSAYRGSYWVAPDLGYALVRAVSDRRPAPGMPWKVVTELDHDGFVNVDGAWLPTDVKFRRFAYYDAGDAYELRQDLSATFSNWRRNAPDSRPEPVAFPEDAVVRDRRPSDAAR